MLVALVVGGAAVAGFLRPGLPDGWDQNTLVIAEDSGSRFVATGDGVLRPVLNIASARLALPENGFRIVSVPDSELAGQRRGETIGIPGAPDDLPPADALVQTGWTSCIDQRGRAQLRLQSDPVAEPVGTAEALTVTVDGALWVLWGGARYPVDAERASDVLLALRLDGTPPRQVPGTWLDLFPEGPALRPLPLAGRGAPAPEGAPSGATTGSVLEVTAADGSATRYLLREDGLVPLTDVAFALYAVGSGSPQVIEVGQGDVAGLGTVTTSPYPEQWPADLPSAWPDDVACALLTTEPDEVPVVALSRLTDEDAAPTGNGTYIEPGRGAVVRAVNGTVVNRGTVFVVDGTGRRYAVGGDTSSALDKLGYADVTPAPVPLAWVEPLADGPELTETAARQVVGGG